MTIREIWEECRLTVLFLAITGLFACFPMVVELMPQWLAILLAIGTVSLLYSLTFFTFSKKIARFPTGAEKAEFLLITYVEIIFLFASVYFLFALIGDASYHFNGRDLTVDGSDPAYSPGYAFVKFFKFLYFSVVTATTLGYGDISPASWQTQAVSMAQVLFALHVVVVGFGSFFSGNSIKVERR